MREIGSGRFEVFNDGERFFEAEVRRMRADADTVEDEDIEIAKSVH